MDSKLLDTLTKKLSKIEKELEKVRGVEYSLPFGSMRRAKVSRKWDMLAIRKRELKKQIDELEAKETFKDMFYGDVFGL